MISSSRTINVVRDGDEVDYINVKSLGTGAAQDLYTVTAGKTFYLMGLWVAGGVAGEAIINDNAGTTRRVSTKCTVAESRSVSASTPIAVYTSEQIVKSEAANNLTYGIWGYEK